MKVLVTGGAGFIGSHIADKFDDVRVLDNLSSGSLKNLSKRVDFIKGDITDYNIVNKAMKDIDYVFHLAAFVSVNESMIFPEKTYEVNVKGTENVLKAAKENNVKKVIYTSTAAVYGDNPNLPLNENSKLNPLSPYGKTKIEAEKLCLEHNAVCLRPFNVFGPRQNPDSPYSGVISIFVKNALQNKDIVIYGDGSQTRDFIFVEDAVKANLLAMKNGNGVYNVGTGTKVSINELAKKIIELTGSKSKIIHSEERKGDIKHSLSDISKIKEIGFDVDSDFEEGLRKTIEWFK